MAEGKELLGYAAKDKITGFSGVITAYVFYISGCNQVLLVPHIKEDGSVIESAWFDVQRIGIDPSCDRLVLDNTSTPGHDAEAPKR